MQSFMSIHITNNNLYVIVTLKGLRLFVVVYKLVNLIYRCGVTVLVLYLKAGNICDMLI